MHATDILRAATVFAHAALEEVMRGLATWKYPVADEGVLNEVPMVGISAHGRPEKFFLGKLAAHRNKTVQQLITESVSAHLGNFTVSNTTDLSVFLRKIHVNPETVNNEFTMLSELIARRHHIVHQADRNDVPGQGHHRARQLNPDTVTNWVAAVRRFTGRVLDQVPD